MFPKVTSEIVERKTRKGAENYIRNLGYTPGVTQNDSSWNGRRAVPVALTFDVVKSWDVFAVVRTTEYLEA